MECSVFRHRVIFFLVLPFLLLRPPRLTAQNEAPPEDTSKYLGVEVCQGCHEDAYNTFMKSPHVDTLNSKSVSMRGCEGCHGPGADHVNAGGDPGQIERYAGAAVDIIVARCQRCHLTQIGKQHAEAHLSCLTCHSAHHARPKTPLLIKPAAELCRSCHHR